KQKNIEIKCNFDANCKVFFDRDKLEKICTNLIHNALKYTENNGQVTLNANCRADGMMELEFIDTGKGISSNDLPHIFDRFYRVKDNLQQGSGIGLALVKELVVQHKGIIEVKSVLNQGTTFKVILPFDQSKYETHEILVSKTDDTSLVSITPFIDADKLEPLSIEKTKLHPDKRTLLIVEDNLDLQRYIADIFSADFELLLASNGEEGYQLTEKYIPDIIISDIMMPVLSGIQLVDKIKKNSTTSHIPVILLTAKNDIGTRLTGFEKGADDYISKPFESLLLKSRVENLLRLRKQLVEKFSKQFHLEPREITIEDSEQKFLQKTIEIIEKNIAEPNLNVDFLALELGVSRTQLYRKLKALTDYSANQFIRIIRLKRAAQILKQGQNNIAEVMDAT
ncbi:MAG: response regulator, partial [Bacteroidales bacterium]|nr:response regulator [Bacteroidales bacterium]